jgi:hypothetical protein
MLSARAMVAMALVRVEPTGRGRFVRTVGRLAGASRQTGRAVYRAAAILGLMLIAQPGAAATAAAALSYRSDEWLTECDGRPGRAGDCSITVPFWQTGARSRGSFALVVMLQTGNVGIVGEPYPQKAVLRVDKNPAAECRQTRYCIFPPAAALAIVNELETGSLILIDVYTARGEFSFSLTPKGYQAGVAQVRAWGAELPPD